MSRRNVIIVGSDPAGCTAARYTSRADLQPLVFEGAQYGGALMNAWVVADRNEQPFDFKAAGDLVKGQVDLDDEGYVLTHDGTYTNLEGVFAAGDLVDNTCPQAIAVAGTGSAPARAT